MAVCVPSHNRIFMFLEKNNRKGYDFPIIFITFARRYPFAHAELMLFFLFKGEMGETRTWEGRGVIHNIKVRLLCA